LKKTKAAKASATAAKPVAKPVQGKGAQSKPQAGVRR